MFEDVTNGEAGTVFAGYDKLSRLFHMDEDVGFGQMLDKLVSKIDRHLLPASVVERLTSRHTHASTGTFYSDAIFGAKRDIVLYHAWALALHSEYDRQAQCRRIENGDAISVSKDMQEFLWSRCILDTADAGLTDFGELTVYRDKGSFEGKCEEGHQVSPEGVTTCDEFPAARVFENPASIGGLVDIHHMNPLPESSVTALVHGHPVLMRNKPIRNGGGQDAFGFERNQIELLMPGASLSPNGRRAEVFQTNPSDMAYFVLPGHLRKQVSGTEKRIGSHMFANEILAPRVREEFGVILPREVHKEAFEAVFEGEYVIDGKVIVTPAAIRKAEARDFYLADDLAGTF